MNDFTALIQAFATLLWPVFALWALYTFKDQIREILRRIKKGEVWGQEIELETALIELTDRARQTSVLS